MFTWFANLYSFICLSLIIISFGSFLEASQSFSFFYFYENLLRVKPQKHVYQLKYFKISTDNEYLIFLSECHLTLFTIFSESTRILDEQRKVVGNLVQ